MIVFIEKVRVRSNFTIVNPIITEPLELLYIRELLNQEGIDNYIIDPLFDFAPPSGIVPDMVILNGYNVSEYLIIEKAREYKKTNINVKTLVSGVHAQVNREVFRVEGVDFVFFSQSLETFRGFLYGDKTKGVDSFDCNRNSWVIGSEDILREKESTLPDRSIFNDSIHETRYLDKKNISLIKGNHGCPYSCKFCFCRLLNSSFHIKGNYHDMFKEIINIDSTYHWIVDDSLLISRGDAIDFIEASNCFKFDGSIIAYLRADFIMENRDLLNELNNCGLDEVIIGFESANKKTLKEYNKSIDSSIYKEVVKLLKEHNIQLTALFIVDPDYSIKDFYLLNKFIRDVALEVYTLSIMTPIKGTNAYEENKDKLITNDPVKFDFLHLVIPSKLPKVLFYFLFYLSHLRLLKSRRIRKMLKDSVFKGRLWDFWAKRYKNLWVQKYSLKPTRDRIKALINTQDYKSKKLLDIGCGTGQLLSELDDLENLSLSGLDFSKEMIRQSKKANLNAKHYHMDVDDLDQVNDKFDIITCSHSLPYYKNKRRTLEKISQILDDNGKTYIAFASGESLVDRLILLFVKVTTGPAKYPSDLEFRRLIEGIFLIDEYETIKERFFMPTIALYTLRKV